MKTNQLSLPSLPFSVLVFLSVLLAGCGPSREELEAIDASIAPLRKIGASTKSGVTIGDFGKLYIEAQAAYETQAPKIRNAEFHTRMRKALEAYEDSLKGWKATQKQSLRGIFKEYRGKNSSFSVGEEVFVLVDKYNMKWEDFDGKSASFIPYDQFVSNMWEFGSKETSAAAAAVRR